MIADAPDGIEPVSTLDIMPAASTYKRRLRAKKNEKLRFCDHQIIANQRSRLDFSIYANSIQNIFCHHNLFWFINWKKSFFQSLTLFSTKTKHLAQKNRREFFVIIAQRIRPSFLILKKLVYIVQNACKTVFKVQVNWKYNWYPLAPILIDRWR